MEEAKALAQKILAKSPVAVALAKSCLRAADEMPLSAGLSYETAAFGVVGATQDKVEGMTAFLEKRKPVWKGA
jgi:enoyl-CoA hydratase/carnithine racemase